MRTRSIIALTIAASAMLIPGACSSDSGAGPQTFTVDTDIKSDPAVNVGSTAFFPEQLRTHPGDTVRFRNNFTGEPHTVTLGRLVDTAIAEAKAVPPNPTGPPAPEPASLKKLPSLLPDGPGDAPQASANPCYIDTGDLPTDPAQRCATSKQPAFTGRQAFYNSGYLPSGTNFTVKIDPKTAPGKYWFFCLLHRAGMSGAITVVDKKTTIPDAGAVQKAGAAAQSQLTQQLQAAVNNASSSAAPRTVAAGVGAVGVQNATAEVFVPANVNATVGATVTWTVSGPHTIAFNPPAQSRLALTRQPDGTWHLNQPMFTPNPPGPPPLDGGGRSPVVIDGGKWDGTGYKSSGLMLAFGPPGGYSYKLAFTKAGTYTYECQVHPGMAGTVKVA